MHLPKRKKVQILEIKVQETQNVNQTAAAAPKNQDVNGNFKFTLVGNLEKSELQEKLTKLMKEITEQGERIAKHMDIKDMRAYRAKIKEFMNEVSANSHEFSRENFLDRRGRHRVYGIVRKVDATLDDLAEELLKDEKDNIAILQKVDDIRGMLLDIST
ncbi:MAG: YaaR family protein [Lachnospiraceae bacterium]|nr:YaaR family protein [Lachnospiraceae bacterium]